jgi:hypothetical protein
MASNGHSPAWPQPPPQKGPPPKIPSPKPPVLSQTRTGPVSPVSELPGGEYFSKINYSPSSPTRVPPRTNVRAPLLQRVSEHSIDDENADLDPVPTDHFRATSDGSPVSPYTILDGHASLPIPGNFELDQARRQGSLSSGGNSTSQSRTRSSHGRSSLSYTEEDEPPPFVMKSDKHKRILGITEDPRDPRSKKTPDRKESAGSISSVQRKASGQESTGNRSKSPTPANDVAPFLYPDGQVVNASNRVNISYIENHLLNHRRARRV